MDKVKLYHPELDAECEVTANAAKHMLPNGWELADRPKRRRKKVDEKVEDDG